MAAAHPRRSPAAMTDAPPAGASSPIATRPTAGGNFVVDRVPRVVRKVVMFDVSANEGVTR